MGWSLNIRVAALAAVVILVAGCKSDGEPFFGSTLSGSGSTSSSGKSAPTIVGSPKPSVTIGEKYLFVPRASGPDGRPLNFDIRNRPRWAAFDSATGALSGQPTKDDVGIYPDVTITVTDGSATRSLAPFDIKVVDGTGSSSSWTPSTQPRVSAGAAFEFAEIPEIVFVRGYAETEHMGIFHLDTLNRWVPGDLENRSGWKPRIATQLVVVSGSMSGVTYDPATGVLSYNGFGSGSETATVYLEAPSVNARSAEFSVRVLAPTIAWGVDAAKRFPDIGLDSATTPWTDMQRQMRSQAPHGEPNVLLVTPGTYTDDLFIAADRLNIYILGEPSGRPVFRGDNFSLSKFETVYLKNLDLWDTTVAGGGYLTDRKVNFYATKIYQHDGTREQSGFGSPAYEGSLQWGIVVPPGEWRHWIWNFHGSQMGGTGNTTHQFYLEGRPNTYALFNNVRITGSRGSSSIKSTRYHNIVRNSYVSALLDPSQPQLGLRSDKLLDIVSVGEAVIYNNEFVGARSKAAGGIGAAMVHFRARRDWWASDSPAYPDVSYSPATTSLYGGGYLAPPGFSAGPETFVSTKFWDTVGSHDLQDANNPYSFKKFLSYNTFRWIEEGEPHGSPLRDDGTAPRTAESKFSHAELWGSVPENWIERSVTFVANNRYDGWVSEDMSNTNRWIDMVYSTPESLVTRVGPGPWKLPAPPRTLVAVGGEAGPAGAASPVELPAWFRK
jgi:hypothetical protein